MAIIKQYHRDTDTTYVYESTSYWDPEKGQSRSKRKCIGKIDPDTGKIIPTGKRGRKKKDQPAHAGTEKNIEKSRYEELLRENLSLKDRIIALEKRYSALSSEKEALKAALDQIGRIVSES